MVVVCRMAPQAAFLEQSLAVGHRNPAGSTTRTRRAWSSSAPAGTLQKTTPGQWPHHPPVHRAGKGSERRAPIGTFYSFRSRGRPGTTEEDFSVSVLALMALEGFFHLAGFLRPSGLQQQRATASPTLWTVHRMVVASPGHTGARRGVEPASG